MPQDVLAMGRSCLFYLSTADFLQVSKKPHSQSIARLRDARLWRKKMDFIVMEL